MTAPLVTCPNGHRARPVRVIFGMPSPELLARAQLGDVRLGGCDPTFGPEYVCAACGEAVKAARRTTRHSAGRRA